MSFVQSQDDHYAEDITPRPSQSSLTTSMAWDAVRPNAPAISQNGTSISSARPPIHEAVNPAFGKSDAARQFDPQLVAQITEQVINSLRATGIASPVPNQTQQPPPSQFPQSTPAYPSAAQTSAQPPRSPESPTSSSVPRYTPPSPTRYETSSFGSSSPEPQFAEPALHSSRDAPKSRRRRDSNASPTRREDVGSRPRPARISSAAEETTLERIWQPLFDNGRPTPRLGQFLRGLAKHIIDDFEPKNSLVITPGKLVNFYEATKLFDELYPWSAIFGGRMTNASISRLYRDLRCQHHLVQFTPQDAPSIPGLTPHGFEAWMTTLILAYPDNEFERLAKAVLEMPIDNAENARERFPKELSRRLFPRNDDVHQQQRFTAAISADLTIQLRNSNAMPPPPPMQPPPQNQSFGSSPERERNPYSSFTSSSSAHSSAIDDDDLRAPSMPIERERQPYTAREGSGKVYETQMTSTSGYRSDGAATSTRPSRSSTAIPIPPPFAQSNSSGGSRSTDLPPSSSTSNRSHRMSMNAGRSYGASPTRGILNSNPYTRSEGTNMSDIPASYYASNIHPSVNMDAGSEEQYRKPRRGMTDDDVTTTRGYNIPARAAPGGGSGGGSGFDYGPGSQSSSFDGRRGGGGTDGYGSYAAGGAAYMPPPPPQSSASGARY